MTKETTQQLAELWDSCTSDGMSAVKFNADLTKFTNDIGDLSKLTDELAYFVREAVICLKASMKMEDCKINAHWRSADNTVSSITVNEAPFDLVRELAFYKFTDMFDQIMTSIDAVSNKRIGMLLSIRPNEPEQIPQEMGMCPC